MYAKLYFAERLLYKNYYLQCAFLKSFKNVFEMWYGLIIY